MLAHANTFSINRPPSGVRIDSGWNCTPSIGAERCRTAMTSGPADAIISRHAGNRVAAREWYRPTGKGDATPAKSGSPPCTILEALPWTTSGAGPTVPPKRLHDRLVPQAHTEHRDLPFGRLDQRHAASRRGRRPRAGREHNQCARDGQRPSHGLLDRHSVSPDLHLRVPLRKLIDQVPREGIEVVDEHNAQLVSHWSRR